MIVSNTTLDILLVAVFKAGVFGLALSSAVSCWIYFLVLIPHYFNKNCQLKFSLKNVLWSDLPELLKIGFPGALILFCMGLREPVLNRIVIKYVGQDGISAKAALSMTGGIFTSVCQGTGIVVRMLASIYRGEEDRDSLKALIRICATRVMVLSLVITGLMVLVAGNIAGWYFPDRSSAVYMMAYEYFVFYAVGIPLMMIVQIENNYLQAMGHNICVNVISVMDGFISVILPAFFLAPVFGVLGIWAATPVGSFISALIYPIYAAISRKGIPQNTDEWLMFKKDFGVEDKDRLVIHISDRSDVTKTAEKTQEFCLDHGISKKTALFSALCLEEMTRNVVDFGFNNDRKKHYLDSRIIYKNNEIMLRIKDDCKPFDPVEMYKHINNEDPAANIGIKLVMKIADDVSYQNLLGLNVLTVSFR
ncbi:MAG: ATP-binding protein, partial [Lachnospiraceae bacterium]|nr:ATP-binding protein [Lachnospiraceae bacterium]